MRRMLRSVLGGIAALVAGCLLLAGSSCNAYYDLEPLGAGLAAVSDAGASEDVTTDGDTSPDAADGSVAAPCLDHPEMVRAGASCIDRTEVSVAAYAAFVDAAKPADQAPACSWNKTFVPQGAVWPAPAATGELPIDHVDWCDASAYCAWAGKRLCGSGDGTKLDVASAADPTKSEWIRACTHAGARAYPYGDVAAAGRCNTGTGKSAAVGSATGCEGGYPGIFDMTGNVEEWTDACDGDGPDDACVTAGGSYQSTDASCAAAFAAPRSTVRGSIGFRCCR